MKTAALCADLFPRIGIDRVYWYLYACVYVWVAGVLSYIDASDGKHSREMRVLQVCSAFLATAPRSF